MENITNYIKINENISSSGQLSQDEFTKIASEGFEVVINLSTSFDDDILVDEDKIVTNLGMNYMHIPVDFENPTKMSLKFFIQILTNLENKKVWVHCTKNYRVSAFMYVHHKYILRTPFDDIDLSIFEQWAPNENFRELMKISPDELEVK